ncbi:MAG: HEAT repeat domain-containing protein [Elusimicrobiales bacterium]|nr:HEAT repeat domain-containing protein [Elusimicrobiales bacterium]
MNGTLKNLTLISAIFCFTAQAFATGTEADANLHQSETSAYIQQATQGDEASREAAVDALLANVETYQAAAASPNKGPYEDNLKARLKAIDSIWALGEIGDPRLMAKLSKFYGQSDDVLKINLIISIGKLKKNSKAGPYMFDIAADARETEVVRAAAFELLEHIKYPSTVINLQRSATGIEKADLIYTGGITGSISGWFSPDLPIGHAGLFVGTEAKDGKLNVVIADCVPDNFKPGGVRNIYSWYNFTHHYMYPYYGNRTTAAKPTAAQRERIAKLGIEMGKKGLHYSDTHFSQKGPVDFDCVGYTEYLYEAVGLNPTDNSYETGAGWPLTPWEQFISVKPAAAKPAGAIIVPNQNIVTPSQAIITNGFNALGGAFGTLGLRAPEVNTDIQPELID